MQAVGCQSVCALAAVCAVHAEIAGVQAAYGLSFFAQQFLEELAGFHPQVGPEPVFGVRTGVLGQFLGDGFDIECQHGTCDHEWFFLFQWRSP